MSGKKRDQDFPLISAQSNKIKESQNTNIKLIYEIQNNQNQIELKKQIEKFVLEFNFKPINGIEYLNNTFNLNNDSDQLALILLKTDGISKQVMGEYFGNSKEFNQNVLQSFCKKLDFQNLQFDKALRLFLTRFKLPGEAQQIERIMNAFSKVYQNDNPNVFADQETTFVMSYSLIMLNTDIHSDKIEKSCKMTKEQFIKNNIRICPIVSIQYLEDIYDRISKEKFKTDIDHIEEIYQKINQNIQQDFLNLTNELIHGQDFTKFGAYGKPQKRYVYFDQLMNKIQWKNSQDSQETARFIYVDNIIDIYIGSDFTQKFIQNKNHIQNDKCCFSFITKERTLDLEAQNIQIRQKWIKYFKLKFEKKRQNNLEKDNQIEYTYENIWKNEIIPNWDYHWNYTEKKPRNYEQLHQQNRQNSQFSIKRIFQTDITIQDLQKFDNDQHISDKKKTVLLLNMWQKGIPDWARKFIWLLIVGNSLEITQNLYKNLKKQIKYANSFNNVVDKDFQHSLERMQLDLKSDTINNFETIENVLKVFYYYRPDIGYISGIHLLVQILLTLYEEDETFQFLINLLHSEYFIPFYRGEMREIEWRVQYFNTNFEQQLPQLYKHFIALDLSTEIYLLPWFLSLFANILKIQNCKRVWDNFLLDGEVYAIRAGLGLLKYFEIELKISNFDDAVAILLYQQEVHEDTLIQCIDQINVNFINKKISYEQYQHFLNQQKIANLKTLINQVLIEIN